MEKKISFTLLMLILSVYALAQKGDLSYYLPTGITYDTKIPSPKSIIGHEVGEWHITHDKLVSYMYAIANASDRITIEETGRTFENRPLLLLTITSTQNQGNIKKIQSEHLKLSQPEASQTLDITSMPAVAYLGYSVHGNEASGSNAALLTAYYLAAAKGKEIDSLLNHTIILLDPSFNPDGLNRFASWVNTHKSETEVTDPNHLEFNEISPKGRTNHYWFDLNRDWLTAQLPESKARIKKYHQWKPNILTDHHEMGTNSTFFFQPGIPSRNHPITPENTYLLTEKIAQYHAKALDDIGSLYYSKESFDDFYYGKGSSFPDVNGGIGILFEQASSRGHAQESENGILRFPFAIKNHFTVTLSTLKATLELRKNLLSHQREFFKSALSEADKDPIKGYVLSAHKDKSKAFHFLQLLNRQQIDAYKLTQKIKIEGKTFNPGESYIIPLKQAQYRLINGMFEKRTTFQDSLFYDVSAWTLPLSFGLNYATLTTKNYKTSLLAEKVQQPLPPQGEVVGGQSAYAYAFEWHEYYAPRLLNQLLTKGYKAKVAKLPFTNPTTAKQFKQGSILIPVAQQNSNSRALYNFLKNEASRSGIDVYGFASGNTKGINLGSPNFKSLKRPKAMILVGDGVTSYDAGEVWHLMDQRMKVPLSLVTIEKFNEISPDRYKTIVMVNGNYGKLNKAKLKLWVQKGGIIIAMKKAGKWLSDNGISKVKYKKKTKIDSLQINFAYASLDRRQGAQFIGGAIFKSRIDLSHPIGYGYENSEISIFRNSTLFMEKAKNPFANPLMYTENPLASGYISDENLDQLKSSAAVGVSVFGKGKVITFADNPNFRAFWYGTNKMFLNAVFFGSIIETDSAK